MHFLKLSKSGGRPSIVVVAIIVVIFSKLSRISKDEHLPQLTFITIYLYKALSPFVRVSHFFQLGT